MNNYPYSITMTLLILVPILRVNLMGVSECSSECSSRNVLIYGCSGSDNVAPKDSPKTFQYSDSHKLKEALIYNESVNEILHGLRISSYKETYYLYNDPTWEAFENNEKTFKCF